jgi:CheY-like chemotaxis protein
LEPSTTVPPKKRVLIADDYPDTAASCALLLASYGYETFIAVDGVEALEIGRTVQPHAVLLDISMPGLDGPAVCRRLRQEPWARSALMIAITGWVGEARRTAALEAGCDHCLIKPVDIIELCRLIDDHQAATRDGEAT